MITEDQVWTVLVESNPIPDVDSLEDLGSIDVAAYLATLDERSSDVTQLDDKRTTETPKRSMIGWMVAAIAVILIGVVVVLTNQRSDNEVPPATEPPPAPTTTMAPEAAEVTAVLSAIEAFNSGDGEAWRAKFEPSADEVADTWRYEFNDYRTHDVMMAANEQLTVVGECEIATEGPAMVVCLISETNDWHGKAGITHEIETTFNLNDDLLITGWAFGYGCCDDEFAFNNAFQQWMREAHPDIHSEIRAVDQTSFPGFQRDPAHMATAIQYVDEFLAQSETYPADLHTQVVGEE